MVLQIDQKWQFQRPTRQKMVLMVKQGLYFVNGAETYSLPIDYSTRVLGESYPAILRSFRGYFALPWQGCYSSVLRNRFIRMQM